MKREEQPDEAAGRTKLLWGCINRNLIGHYQAEFEWVRRLRADIESAGKSYQIGDNHEL